MKHVLMSQNFSSKKYLYLQELLYEPLLLSCFYKTVIYSQSKDYLQVKQRLLAATFPSFIRCLHLQKSLSERWG